MLLRNDARRARDDLLDIALSLPFQTEVRSFFQLSATLVQPHYRSTRALACWVRFTSTR